jgi:hypothetical protein
MYLFLGMAIEQNKQDLTIHLDTYIQETSAEYKEAVTKFLEQKQVPMQPGIKLELEDRPESPDPVKQKVYRLFVARLQFAASCVSCDMAFTVSQWARFCASAGPSHWAALHHVRVMEYLEENPSLKLSYQRGGPMGWMDSQTSTGVSVNSSINDGSVGTVQSRRGPVAVQDAKEGIAFDDRGRVLLGIGNGYRGAVPTQSA